MSARPFLRHGQRIASGPVADMHRPTTPVDLAMIGAALVFLALPAWIAWGAGLPVVERRMKATLLTLPLWPVPSTDACAWALVATGRSEGWR